jgi:2,4'-dihydroxyacetophenone dioxygenase
MLNLPDAAPDLKEILIQSDEMAWREKSLKGIAEKMLWRDEASGASIAPIRFAAGAGIPEPHLHAGC